jgi:hypothetical protein
MSEMSLQNCSVGSIMGAMIQQIGMENEKVIKESLKHNLVEPEKGLNKKVSSSLMRK